MESNTHPLLVAVTVGLLVGSGLTAAVGPIDGAVGPFSTDDRESAGDDALVTFENESSFSAYVQRGQQFPRYHSSVQTQATVRTGQAVEADTAAQATPAAVQTEAPGGGSDTDRIGTTNVQEVGIDEPDRVKTDGSNFYYAPTRQRLVGSVQPLEPRAIDDAFTPQPRLPGRTHVVDTDDPANPSLIESINSSGQLIQTGETLIVIEQETLTAYDVSDPENPTVRWDRPVNGSVVTSRVQDGTLYLVTQSSTAATPACPLKPVGGDAAVDCSSIYRPTEQIRVDATYVATAIAPKSGDVTDSTAFVGTTDNTAVYMSEESLYVTYTTRKGEMELASEYLQHNASDVPPRVKNRLAAIESYEISRESKSREIRLTVERWLNGLSAENRSEREAALEDGLTEYMAAHKRDATRTGIVQLSVADLAVENVGEVPGVPLNQFSMDEHEGTVRIATTIPRIGDAESENDLYVLDSTDLSEQGSVTGMGDDQRVYSVRYVGDTAYVVTYRQVDPFHVVDLSNPAAPEEVGELKLPGFSSYLHPVSEDHILGIGREDGRVKATLFDVSDPSNPTIADDKRFEYGYSGVAESHHAFMQDRKHEVVFLPVGNEGLVVSYANESLSVERRIQSATTPDRARYVGDYLYVFAPSELTVLDERTWNETAAVDLPPFSGG
jgi:uncharacterized secreted protein with C-terminal beta-propeller domain